MTEKIVSVLKRRGPSLPVHISKETGLSILFAGAFLSQLVSERRIKISNMKVGSSPVYFLNEHNHMLERFGQHLKSKEKEAFLLIKDRKFLKDSEQTPAIRVALREIRDFAIPFSRQGETFWRYYTAPESEFNAPPRPEIKKTLSEENGEPQKSETGKEFIALKLSNIRKETPKQIGVPDKARSEKSGKGRGKIAQKKKVSKKDDNFFNTTKEWVSKNSMEILDIESFKKNEIYLRAKNNGKEILIAAYNKKRITEMDMVKASKKSKDLGLRYIVLSLGEPQKKMMEFINALENLSGIQKLE